MGSVVHEMHKFYDVVLFRCHEERAEKKEKKERAVLDILQCATWTVIRQRLFPANVSCRTAVRIELQ